MRTTMTERRTITKLFAERYQRLTKKQKGELLEEYLELTGYDRCYGAWLLRTHGKRVVLDPQRVAQGDVSKHVRRECQPFYDQAVKLALVKVWMILDCICGKRLAPILAEIVTKLEACGELRLKASVREKLISISAATIDRLLASEREKMGGRKVGHTKPGTLLKHQIPVRTFADWNEQEPGFVEIDLVGHEGGNASGDFCFTLDLTDVYSGWTETRAVRNKARVWVVQALDGIATGLPFSLKGVDSDNGSEFINEHLYSYCVERHLTFTRARSGRKNDNCYIEQKNYSVVRRAVGYARYETEEQLGLLNELYDHLRLYTNYFQPVMKLREKKREGSKVSKRYDPARTPYQRLLDAPQLSKEQKQRLRREYGKLNPAQLKREITRLQEELLKSASREAKVKSRQARSSPQAMTPR